MNILIDNANFVNKGAELMLRSVIKESKKKHPGSRFVITPHSAGGNYAKPIGEGLFIYQRRKLFNYFPKSLLDKLYFVKPSKIDVLLDAGGFQFSDQWLGMYSAASNKKLEQYYKSLKENGTKLIFLPQAFGPFTHQLSIERMKIVFKYADVLFAREKVSYNYLVELFGENKKVILKPDFTNLLKPAVPTAKLVEDRKYVCVVPNYRMVTETSKEVSSQYLSFITKLCQYFVDRGEQLILLNHEGIGDEEIINKIQEGLSSEVLKLNNLNALEVKAVIGKMKLLVSSRFHGVVSGLSQQVCTFCTGWSHKYAELMADYQVPENLLDINDFASCQLKMEEALGNPRSVHHVSSEVIKSLEQKSQEMWKLVWAQ
ncbi:polysaccharide pyruvyl transferase family protein [Paraflavisolibacter sp. H34]|uniref:polysaccharide pyruvyl transferase family protein n=1 Tax=Huijunlia imazamoxiresistens TaxID=3127457 RepID=UPI003019A9D5